MFTQGQAQRMRIALQSTDGGRNNLWTSANLNATGVNNPNALCKPVADFTYNKSFTCVGAPVTFKDASWNGKPSSYTWSFPGGNPSSATDSMPTVVYNTPGFYSATLTTANSAGTASPITKTSIINVVNNTAIYQSPWSDGFETDPLPNNDWRLTNTNGSSNWEQTFELSYSGSACAKLDYTNNTRRAKTAMISPSVKLSAINNPQLSFVLAAAESNPNHVNALQVYISTDCEQSWTQLYNKVGQNLITSFSTDNPFFPLDQNEWRTEIIPLNTFGGADRATFKFEYIRDTIGGANNIFIDDINISTATAMEEITNANAINVFPNPSSGNITIVINTTLLNASELFVIDNLGRQIKHLANNQVKESNGQVQLNLNAGIYFLQLVANQQTTYQKIIITK
jgi:PKD repeat protein